jgi:hypothetical protein
LAGDPDGILDCRRAFWTAFAIPAFVYLEEGHNFRGSSFLTKSSSSSFGLLRSSSSPLSDFKIEILTFAGSLRKHVARFD